MTNEELLALGRVLAEPMQRAATIAAWQVVFAVAEHLRACGCDGCQHTTGRLVAAMTAALGELGLEQ